MDDKAAERKVRIQTAVFGLILAGLTLLVCRLFAPFASILLWSVLLYIVVEPLHRRVAGAIRGEGRGARFLRSLCAALFALASVLVVVIPLCFVLSQVYIQLAAIFESLRERTLHVFFAGDRDTIRFLCENFSTFVRGLSGGQIRFNAEDLYNQVIQLLEKASYQILSYTGIILRDIGLFIAALVMLVVCLFFYFLDGEYLFSLIKSVVPIRRSYITALVDKFKEITRGLVFGYLIVAFVQSLLAFVIFSVFQIQGALLFACLTFVCVFVPVVGGALVWAPIGIIKLASGNTAEGILFIILCGFCVSLLDNALRPYFLQNRLQLHPLLIFFSIFGGILLFGFNGLIMGPMTVVLFLTALEMFFKEHHIRNINTTSDRTGAQIKK
jgi:predicted PurR-regulated permease PerM